jgi:uncharacterized protein (DUF1697 family)
MYIAFFRNVNLGHPKSPNRSQLEEAFLEAGAESAHSFQTNGTLVFSVTAPDNLETVVADAWNTLHSVCGLQEPVFVSTLEHLAGLVAADPFAGHASETVYEFCASFMPAEAYTRVPVPHWSPRRNVEVIQVTPQAVLCASHIVNGRPGGVTPYLEKLVQAPVTTRSWGTIVRLVRKFSS